MTLTPASRWLALVKLEGSADLARIGSVANAFREMLARWSGGESEMLITTREGEAFGFVFRSSVPAAMMRAEFERSPTTRNGDSIALLELGEDFATLGFSRAATWLQRHAGG